MRWTTAGESHGPELIALLEGLPAGLPLDLDRLQEGMGRRWLAFGRGPRARFESDQVRVLGGTKRGLCLGTPLALSISNGDTRIDELPNLRAPRPGHADLAGALRLRCRDLRAVLERASARETAARTALGLVAEQLLERFGIRTCAFVTAIAGIEAGEAPEDPGELQRLRDASPFFSVDPGADEAWRRRIEQAREAGDSLGGVFEVRAWGLPPGLGGYAQVSDRLDARLMAALATIPAIRGVEIGLGFGAAAAAGSAYHDAVVLDPEGWAGLGRQGNRAGGVEGGLSNGQPVVLRAAMKPIPTLRQGLPSVALSEMREERATYERSDVCSVSAASVAGQAVVALELASALRARLGGVSLAEMLERFPAPGRERAPAAWPRDLGGVAGPQPPPLARPPGSPVSP
ncbi:MAG: chorismate synthase, partial [Planctomycetes bacterium]|nr:chorismate synthase [Planctomycetota bacterium]